MFSSLVGEIGFAARGIWNTLQSMVTETIPQLKTLSLAKKRRLISELLAEVYGEPVQEKAISDALEKRVEHYRENPASAKRWADVKARLRRKS